jgi:HEAT repeat protein
MKPFLFPCTLFIPMEEITLEELHRLREGNIVEQLIVIKRLTQKQPPSPAVIYPLLDIVSGGNEELIGAVAEGLVSMKSIIIPTLKTEITNSNCFIRWAIALAIQEIGENIFQDHLVPALGIGYEPVIKIIIKTLNQMNPARFPSLEFVDILRNLNEHEKNAVGYYAIRQLGTLAYDVTETIFALKTLKDLNWNKAIVPMLKATHHKDYRVREEVKQILNISNRNREIIEECLRALENPHEYYQLNFNLSVLDKIPLHMYAIEGLGLARFNLKKIKRIIINYLQNGSQTEKIFALRSIEKRNKTKERIAISNEIRIALRTLLNNSEESTRLEIIQQLAKLGEDWTLTALTAFLGDNSSHIRLALINALSKSSKNKDILEKVAVLLTDSDKRIRSGTLQLYWKLDPNRFFGLNEGDIIQKMPEPTRTKLLDKILEGLRTGNEDYRDFAAFWLGVLRYQPAYPVLVNNLNHPSEKVQVKVIISLGIFGNRKAIPKLIPFIYKKGITQRKAIESIGSLGLDGLHALIQELFKTNYTPSFLRKHIASFGGRVINYLSQEIDHETKAIRKKNLKNYLEILSKKYQVKLTDSDEDFRILL